LLGEIDGCDDILQPFTTDLGRHFQDFPADIATCRIQKTVDPA
jgi:hypothetical protein